MTEAQGGRRLKSDAPVVLLLADSALELVPQKIAGHSAARNAGIRANKRPTRMVLDGSVHHAAMRKLPDRDSRGRPDIVHFCLLEALGSPLNMEGMLDTWVHTRDDRALHFSPELRLPRNQERFKGIVEKLYADGRLDNGLIEMEDGRDPAGIIDELSSPGTIVVGLDDGGEEDIHDVAGQILTEGGGEGIALILVAGGFAHGGFDEETARLFHRRARVHGAPVDAWVAVSRALAACEARLLPRAGR